MLLYIILYIAGYICSYYTLRYQVMHIQKLDWDWEDIKANSFFSLFSWAWFVVVIVFIFSDWFGKGKPPRWL